jgi:hypothetical protein
MNLEKMPEIQSARVGLPVVDKLPGDGAPTDKKKGFGRTVLYARVSTAEQTLVHQRAQAEAAGFHLDEVVADHGISGLSTTLADRPEGRRLFDMLRAGDTLVVRWVDRLGRNYRDVTDTIREFMRRGVVIRTVINGMVFDGATQDPMQQAVRDALIAFMRPLPRHRPRQPRRRNGLAFSTLRKTTTARNSGAASRASTGLPLPPFKICSAKALPWRKSRRPQA